MKKTKGEKNRDSRMIKVTAIICICIITIGLIVVGCIYKFNIFGAGTSGRNTGGMTADATEETKTKEQIRQEKMADAYRLSQSYDYDGAVDVLKSVENYGEDAQIIQKISEYEALKEKNSPVGRRDLK